MNTKQLFISILILGFMSNNALSIDTSSAEQLKVDKERKFLTLQNVGSTAVFGSGALLKALTPHLFMDVTYVQHGLEKAAKRNARIFMGLGLAGLAHGLYSAIKRPHDSQKTA